MPYTSAPTRSVRVTAATPPSIVVGSHCVAEKWSGTTSDEYPSASMCRAVSAQLPTGRLDNWIPKRNGRTAIASDARTARAVGNPAAVESIWHANGQMHTGNRRRRQILRIQHDQFALAARLVVDE